MPQQGIIFRALIASPSDCVQERKIIPEVIRAWNAVHSIVRSAIVEPVLWETHSRPAFGDRPQDLLNQQLVKSCDLVIGAFWTRLGTPTGKAESGTAEEIEQFRSEGKRLSFCIFLQHLRCLKSLTLTNTRPLWNTKKV